MDNIMQARCDKCTAYQEIRSYFGWCKMHRKYDPMNPYNDGYKPVRSKDKCKWFEPKGETNE